MGFQYLVSIDWKGCKFSIISAYSNYQISSYDSIEGWYNVHNIKYNILRHVTYENLLRHCV